MKKFYITTAIPYVNAKPHIGHALEFVQGDVIARYHRLLGDDTILLSGGDENALKNVQAAEAAGKDVKTFIDENTQSFADLAHALEVQFDVFQKGSDTKTHFPSSQKLWELCDTAGDIYKKSYEGLYCLGCEAFYTKEELNEQGECFEHPGKKLQIVKEENYFFKLSKYQDQIVRRLESDEIKIYPEFRKNEVLSFVKAGLQDISISRSNERAKNWGVPVPNDPTQRIYVWFDALNIYQSGIGFGWDDPHYSKYWPADVHVIGKGISRFHAVYWPAFLLSAGLKLPKSIFVHGYFTVNGQKMSKTLGNVIDPIELINKYGAEPLRYYFLREIPAFSDGDFSETRFTELYNADLANGLGNLVARTAKLATPLSWTTCNKKLTDIQPEEYIKAWNALELHNAIKVAWDKVKTADGHINDTTPWKLTGTELQKALAPVVDAIREIALLIEPFLPETANKIRDQFFGDKIISSSPLFPRL
jgi:methionyl-tRNA synthetase